MTGKVVDGKKINLKDRIPYRTSVPRTAPTDSNLSYRYLNTYEPLPWQLPAMRDVSPVILLTGSQGGGKSRTAAEKIHAFCLNYPGAQALVMRKVKDNVMASAWRMLEKKVVGQDPRVNFQMKATRADYLNGSTIYFAGMHGDKQREAIRSIGEGTIDIVWMEEAHEFEEDDYEETIGRVRGKTATWNQIILTTNPDSPVHWINRRLILGEEAIVHYSSARDNPYNHANYLKRLDGMTGSKGQRLRDGMWVMAAGNIIDTWLDNYNLRDPDKDDGNVTEDADYIDGLPVWIFADDGYVGKFDQKSKMFTADSHPRVFLLAQERSDGQLAVFAESYAVRSQKKEHLDIVKKMCGRNSWKPPRFGVFDSAAPSLGAAMKIAGIRTIFSGTKNLKDSTDVMRDACGADRHGWREIIVHPRCRFLRFEMVTWAYDKRGNFKSVFDNGPDALRYGKYHLDNPDGADADMAIPDDDELETEMSRIDELWDEHFESQGLYV